MKHMAHGLPCLSGCFGCRGGISKWCGNLPFKYFQVIWHTCFVGSWDPAYPAYHIGMIVKSRTPLQTKPWLGVYWELFKLIALPWRQVACRHPLRSRCFPHGPCHYRHPKKNWVNLRGSTSRRRMNAWHGPLRGHLAVELLVVSGCLS